jgi:putative transposase
MLHLIKEKASKFNFDVFSFSLMPNHLHLQIRSNEVNLPKAMKNLFETYANFFNNKYSRRGHVFSGVYRQALCLDDSYLLATSLYIHLNAVKAGLARNPAKYRWSSCHLYVAPIDKRTFIDYRFILRILDQDIEKARGIYKKLLAKARAAETREIADETVAVASLKEKMAMSFPRLFTKKNLISNIKAEGLFDEELEEKIKELKGKQRLRNPQDLTARRYLIEQLRARGYSISEIARVLSLTRPTIYATLNFTHSSRT